jgi:hypothetical protein
MVDRLPVEVWNRIGQLVTGKDPARAPHEACARLRLVNHTAARAMAIRLYYCNCRRLLVRLDRRVETKKNAALKRINLDECYEWEAACKIVSLEGTWHGHVNKLETFDHHLVRGARTDDPEACKTVLTEARLMYARLQQPLGIAPIAVEGPV